MKTMNLLLTICIVNLACKSKSEPIFVPKSTIIGQWYYVGKFSHLADYKCLVCPDFDPEKSIYKINFNANGTLDTKINLLIGKADFESIEQQNNYNPQIYKDLFTSNGTIFVKNLVFLNKPPQTTQDTEFIKNLESSQLFNQKTNTANQPFDELSLTYNPENFLFFVRKR